MQVRWSGIPISLRMFHSAVIHTVKGFGVVSETEVDIFLEPSYLLYDSMVFGNLISGSSAFSKSSLNIWKFTSWLQPTGFQRAGHNLTDSAHR